MNDIPNHFGHIEVLLERRRKVLAGFENCAPNELYGRLQGEVNFVFYKAIIEEMRKLVAAYDAEFKSEANK